MLKHSNGLTIQQAANRLGMSADTIRYYDRNGLLPHLQRDINGYRLFTERDLYDLKMIQCFRDVGVSIEELSAMLRAPFISEKDSIMVRQRVIQKQKEKLVRQREQIDFALLMIEMKQDHYAAIESGQKHTSQAQKKIIDFILKRTFEHKRNKTSRILEEAFNKQQKEELSAEFIEKIVSLITGYIKSEYQDEIRQSIQWIRNF